MKRLLRDSWSRVASASAALIGIIAFLAPCAAQATPYVVKLFQRGNDVVAVGSGEFDLTGLINVGHSTLSNGVNPSFGDLGTGPADSILDEYSGPPGPTTFGNGGWTQATTGAGDAVELYATKWAMPQFNVPVGYLSGTALANSSTWNNASFASLGITPGKYTWTWGSAADQSFTLDAVTTVPEPAALGMLGFGLLLVGGFLTLRPRQGGSA